MTVDIAMLVVIGGLYSCGIYLLLERSIMRMLLGIFLMGNATNLLLLSAGGAIGNPPIIGRRSGNREHMTDPLAQGMILTAIVITMGVGAFVLALAYRSFTSGNAADDEVTDDVEDTKVSTRSPSDAPDRDRDSPEQSDESDVAEPDPATDASGDTERTDTDGPSDGGENR